MERMKKCYVTGKEITVGEAIRSAVVIMKMGEVDEEFTTYLTDKYSLIRCVGDENEFYTAEDIVESEGKLTDELEDGVVLSGESVAEAIRDYMESDLPYNRE